MMPLTYLGHRPYSFTGDNGNQYEGTTLYAAHAEEGVYGLMAGKFSVKNEVAVPSGLKTGDTIEVTFNHKGKIVAIKKA